MLAYRRSEKRVEVLFLLHLENNQPGSRLNILHPGNVACELIKQPWPLPSHSREGGAKPNILQSIYGDAFQLDKNKGTLLQTSGLTAWDSLFAYAGEVPVTVWPAGDEDPADGNMTRVFPKTEYSRTGFVPFSEFQLGLFRKVGHVLIAFKLWFEADSYTKLLGGRSHFTVDGPESLLIRLKREHFPSLPRSERKTWDGIIQPFEDYISFGESYDVIVLGHPLASTVICSWRNGIVKAPIQPAADCPAERYITAYPRFVLALEYSQKATPPKGPDSTTKRKAQKDLLTRE